MNQLIDNTKWKFSISTLREEVGGMGDGNLRKGINRMYGMMDNLERMA